MLVPELGQADHTPFGHGMQPGDRQRIAVLSQLFKLQAGGQPACGTVNKSQVYLSLQQQINQAVGAILYDVDRNIRIAAAKSGEHPPKVDTLKTCNDPKGQRSLMQSGIKGHLLFQCLRFLQNLSGPHHKLLSCLRQHGSSGIAVKQNHAQFFFQLGNLLGQGRLPHMTALRRKGKVPRICHRQDIAHNI